MTDIEKDSNREAFEAIPKNARLLRGAIFKDGEYVALSLFDESSKELAAQLNYGWSMWQAAKAQAVPEGFVLVPVDTLEECLDWAHIAKWDSPSNEVDKKIAHHEAIIESAISAQEQSHE